MTRTIEQTATMIYNQVYADLTSKSHRASVQRNIKDWLEDGNLDSNKTVAELTEAWRNDWAWVERQSDWS